MKNFFKEFLAMIRPEHIGLFFVTLAMLAAMAYDYEKTRRLKSAIVWLIVCNLLLAAGSILLAYMVWAKVLGV